MKVYYPAFLLLILPAMLFSQEISNLESVKKRMDNLGASGNVVIEADNSAEIAPDFEMTMEDGSKKKLSDFQGEVLYVSFWASWCGPCIKGFNNYRELRNDMDSIGVVLLNISVDEDYDSWKSAIEKHKPLGTQAIVSQDDLRELYQLYKIPRYEIIGKNSEFLYLSDEPNRDVLGNFQKFVDQ